MYNFMLYEINRRIEVGTLSGKIFKFPHSSSNLLIHTHRTELDNLKFCQIMIIPLLIETTSLNFEAVQLIIICVA